MDDRRDRLEQLRDRLTEEVEAAEGPGLAPLARELRAVLAELDALPTPQAASPTDEIGSRRDERRRKAAGA
jgi:hypothetical protein